MTRQIKTLAPFIVIAAIVLSFPFLWQAWQTHNPFYGKWENDIYYYNDSNYNKTLDMAISRWEATGISIDFKETEDKSSADLIISSDRSKLQKKCKNCLGWALIGDSMLYKSKVYLLPANPLLENQVVDFYKLQTVIHELGHVLGLGHNREPCSTMNSNSFCHQEIRPRVDENGTYMACGPWASDIAKLQKLYPEVRLVEEPCRDRAATLSFYSNLLKKLEKREDSFAGLAKTIRDHAAAGVVGPIGPVGGVAAGAAAGLATHASKTASVLSGD